MEVGLRPTTSNRHAKFMTIHYEVIRMGIDGPFASIACCQFDTRPFHTRQREKVTCGNCKRTAAFRDLPEDVHERRRKLGVCLGAYSGCTHYIDPPSICYCANCLVRRREFQRAKSKYKRRNNTFSYKYESSKRLSIAPSSLQNRNSR